MKARTEREAPKDLTAEQCVLGWALQNAAAAALLHDRVRPGDYFDDRHRLIHTAIARLVTQGKAVTVHLVAATLGMDLAAAGGGAYLADLVGLMASAYGFTDYLAAVRRKAGMRRIREACLAAAAKAANGADPGELTVDLWEQLHDLDAEREIRRPVLVSLSDVQAEAVTWLWTNYFPTGKLTNIMGDPGLGKSYVALDVCARVTRGLLMPDGSTGRSGRAIYLTAEDGLADTVRPRFDRLGGDPTKLVVLQGVGWKDKVTSFNLDADLDMLDAAVGLTHPALVVIDPLSAYLGKTDSHRDADVRGRLAPLAALAERERFAVLCVLHMNKSEQQKAIYRASGALAFVAAARANFGVAEDPEDSDQGYGRKRKLFVPLKINLGPFPPQLAYRISEAGVEWDSAPVTDRDPNVLMAGDHHTDEEKSDLGYAVEFLRQVLSQGPMLVRDIEKEAKQAALSWATVRRAKEELHAVAFKENGIFTGPWLWALKRPE